jgi:hypothetical protein
VRAYPAIADDRLKEHELAQSITVKKSESRYNEVDCESE